MSRLEHHSATAPAAGVAAAAPMTAGNAKELVARCAGHPEKLHELLATLSPELRSEALREAHAMYGNQFVQTAMAAHGATAHEASAHTGHGPADPTHEVGRVHVNMHGLNQHEADGNDPWRLALHGGKHDAGMSTADKVSEAHGRFVVSNLALLCQGKYLVDTKGQPLTDVPLVHGSHVRLNAGTLAEVEIDGRKELCAMVFCASHLKHYESGYIPVTALEDYHRIEGAQAAIGKRMQGAIGREGEHGKPFFVRGMGYPKPWDEHIPKPWHAPLRTFPNQRTDNNENRASAYFGAHGVDGHCSMFASPPYPDFGVAIALLGEGQEFFPTGEEHHATLWYSRDPHEHKPPPEAPHKLPFVKGFIRDASGKHTFGWVNRLQLVGKKP